jgi:hypothetical protein
MRTTEVVVGATYRFFDSRGRELKPRIVIYISNEFVISHTGPTATGTHSSPRTMAIGYFAEHAEPM